MAVLSEKMREAAMEAGLKVGATVKVVNREKEDGRGGCFYTRVQKGEVLALYPYVFVCQIGKVRTSFRYSEFLGEGKAVRL